MAFSSPVRFIVPNSVFLCGQRVMGTVIKL